MRSLFAKGAEEVAHGAPAETTLSLSIRSGPLSGRSLPVRDQLVLGRGEESSVRLPDPGLSRAHLRLRLKRGKVVVEDLGSNNGTFVNGKPVRKQRLRTGDMVRIGSTELLLCSGPPPKVPAEPMDTPGFQWGPGTVDRVRTLGSFQSARLEAMDTGEFLTALGQTEELVSQSKVDDETLRGLQIRTRNFAVVYNLSLALQQPVRLDDLLQTAISFIFKVVPAERCSVLLADPASEELVPRVSRHRSPEVSELPRELSRTIIDRVVAEKRAVISSDASRDSRFATEQRSILDLGLRSVLCVPILNGEDLLGVVQLDRLSGPGSFSRGDFELMTIVCSLLGPRITGVRLLEERERTIERLRESEHALRVSRLDLVWRLAKAAELRDEETGHHVVRVSCYSRAVANALGLPSDRVEALYVAAPLHDIGKIGIPDAILLKPGPLSPEEWSLMKQHCEIGARIMRDDSKATAEYLAWRGLTLGELGLRLDPVLETACEIALTHHEKWDGSGYPAGLAGEAIPLEGRIVAICDVFDALLSKRPYKEPFSVEKALAILEESAGKHFDPRVHAAFVANLDEILRIRAQYADPA